MEGFFSLATAAHLREKLRRDLARLRAAPLDVDPAFNFFVTAEHLADWVHPGKAGRTAREALRDGSALLQATVLGTTIDAVGLAKQVMAFWDAHPLA